MRVDYLILAFFLGAAALYALAWIHDRGSNYVADRRMRKAQQDLAVEDRKLLWRAHDELGRTVKGMNTSLDLVEKRLGEDNMRLHELKQRADAMEDLELDAKVEGLKAAMKMQTTASNERHAKLERRIEASTVVQQLNEHTGRLSKLEREQEAHGKLVLAFGDTMDDVAKELRARTDKVEAREDELYDRIIGHGNLFVTVRESFADHASRINAVENRMCGVEDGVEELKGPQPTPLKFTLDGKVVWRGNTDPAAAKPDTYNGPG